MSDLSSQPHPLKSLFIENVNLSSHLCHFQAFEPFTSCSTSFNLSVKIFINKKQDILYPDTSHFSALQLAFGSTLLPSQTNAGLSHSSMQSPGRSSRLYYIAATEDVFLHSFLKVSTSLL